MKILHNPRCTKSRETLKLLNDKGVNPEIVLYLENIPSPDDLKRILSLLKISAIDIVRKNESLYKENYRNKEFTEGEWIQILSENPKLIERPIVISGNKAVIGRPPENVLDLL